MIPEARESFKDTPKNRCPKMSYRKPQEVRRRYVLENIGQKIIAEIAKDCGVNEKTINRDIQAMKESGEWYDWIEAELLRLHKSRDIDDNTKYKEMSKLYSKGITTKAEVYTEGSQTINVVFDKDMKDEPKDTVPPT